MITAASRMPSVDSLIAGLDPYPKMKDSGVKWLGDVPSHWRVSRLRNMADMRVSNVDKHSRDSETRVRLCNYVDVYHNERITPGLPFMHATATAAEIERFGLRQGDVLITKDSETWNDIGVPALVEETDPGVVVGYHLAILRPYRQSTHPGYLLRALQSTTVASQFHVRANGVTRFGLTHTAIKVVRIPAPPLAEQVAIADFLDRSVDRIQRYVSAKQKLIGGIRIGQRSAEGEIGLLNEYSIRLIADVVTGKLDVRAHSDRAASEI